MRYVIAISGPVAVGKSVLADQFVQRFNTYRLSTRQLLIDKGVENERGALIEAGKKFDVQTDGTWVRDGVLPYLQREKKRQVILIDAVRTERQIHHLREQLGNCFIHVHVTAPFEVAKERYESRAATAGLSNSYEEVRADPTESGVLLLDRIADRVVMNYRCDPQSILARASAGFGLFPLAPERR